MAGGLLSTVRHHRVPVSHHHRSLFLLRLNIWLNGVVGQVLQPLLPGAKVPQGLRLRDPVADPVGDPVGHLLRGRLRLDRHHGEGLLDPSPGLLQPLLCRLGGLGSCRRIVDNCLGWRLFFVFKNGGFGSNQICFEIKNLCPNDGDVALVEKVPDLLLRVVPTQRHQGLLHSFAWKRNQ